MMFLIKPISLLLIFILGFLANRLESHLKPNFVDTPILFNIGKLISYTATGTLLGLLGFLIKINGYPGGILLLIFSLGVLIVTISHIPLLPKIVVIGLKSHHHHKSSFPAGLLNIFSSSVTLHIVMIIAIANGYFIESGFIMLVFALGTLYIPGKKILNLTKSFKVIQFILFILSFCFIAQKGLLYSEIYLFSPFENKKTAVVPEFLDRTQYLKSTTSDLNNRIVVSKGFDINWMIQGEKDGDKIYIPRFKHRSYLNKSYESLVIRADKPGFIYFTGTLGRGDYVIKIYDEPIDVFSLPYEKVMDSGYGDDIHGEGYLADQNIPDIKVTEPGIATIDGETQMVTIDITENGYNPSVVFLKKGTPAILNFRTNKLTEENRRIIMPSYNEYLEFIEGDNPINIPEPLIDFIFYNWKGTFGGYILVVDELEGMTKDKALRQIKMFNVNGL